MIEEHTPLFTPRIRRRLAVAVPVAILVTIAGFVLKALGDAEMPLSERLNVHHHGFVGSLGNALYHGIGPAPAIIGTVIVTAIILVVSRNWARASTFAFTVAASWLSVAVVKLVVHRPRPVEALLSLPYHPIQIDASYPSGHMAFASALVVTTALMLRPGLVRTASAVIGAGILAVIGLLLAIDAVHYPTDLAASLIWVVAVAPLVYEVWTSLVLPRVARRFGRRGVGTAAGAPDRDQH